MCRYGIVIIGRNEGERLKRCIQSVLGAGVVVYVDSGSDDGSVDYAREQNVHVVELDTSIAFSAARARNAGMEFLLQQYPELSYIQFVDGDCEVVAGWIECALEQLQKNQTLAIVCGRRRERFPEASIYNHLCDMEWSTPIGIAASCGGDCMARVTALVGVNGFNPEVIAGEEPDLCFRLRQQGWEIERLDKEMTLHDAKILRFSQWWQRTKRSGHAYMHNMVLHWGEGSRFNIKNVASIIVWGGVIPLLALMLLLGGHIVLSSVLVVLYGLMAVKISNYLVAVRGFGRRESNQYGCYTILGKVPQLLGIVQFISSSLRKKAPEIIEYKN